MSFLADIHEQDGQLQKTYLSAYNTILTYLEFVDEGKGFSEKYLKERFFHRLEFKLVLSKLISHSVLKKSDDGNYYLNNDAKKLNSAVFDNSIFMANKKRTKTNSEPSSHFLYR